MSKDHPPKFFKQALGIMEWMNRNIEDPLEPFDNGNSQLVPSLQNELDLALSKADQSEAELERIRLENCKLIELVEDKEREVRQLKALLEREKWERCNAEVGLAEMARSVARLYERIEELIEKVEEDNGKAVEDDDDDVQIIGVQRNTGGGCNFEELWKRFGLVKSGVKKRYKKWEECGEETRRQLEKTKEFMNCINKTMIDLKTSMESSKIIAEKISPVVVTVKEEPPIQPSTPPSNPITPTPTLMDIDTDDNVVLNQSGSGAPLSPVILAQNVSPADQSIGVTEEPSTLTLTFHRCATPPRPPTTDIPPHQVDFFHSLLGLPISAPYSVAMSPVSPPLPPFSPQQQYSLPSPRTKCQLSPNQKDGQFTTPHKNHQLSPQTKQSPILLSPPPSQISPQHKMMLSSHSPRPKLPVERPSSSPPPIYSSSSVIKFAGSHQTHKPSIPMMPPPPPPSPQPSPDQENDRGHSIDPSKRHLGFYCLCGLECSTKKTLQYHLQYLESSANVAAPNEKGFSPHKKPYSRSKICKRCGKLYTGGKEGLRRHILQEHPSHFNINQIQNPIIPSAIPTDKPLHHQNLPETQFQCNNCPEAFRTVVQLRLHLKVKHSNSQPQRANWKNVDELLP